MTDTQNLNQITVSIGARFADAHASPTETVFLNFDRNAIMGLSPEALNNIISRGLYTVLADIKAQLPKEATREQFKTLMHAQGIEQIRNQCLIVRTKGRGASEYPQATRMAELKDLQKRAIEYLMTGQQFPLVDYTGLSVLLTGKTLEQAPSFTDKAKAMIVSLAPIAERDDVCGYMATRMIEWLAKGYRLDLNMIKAE